MSIAAARPLFITVLCIILGSSPSFGSPPNQETSMKIATTGVFVDSQDKAEAFYTDILGFQVKHSMDMGNGHRWLTVVSQDRPDGIELSLEPNVHPAAKTFQEAMYGDGIPWMVFSVADLDAEFERLTEKGVRFTMKPTDMQGTRMAILDDTCGNLIAVVQE